LYALADYLAAMAILTTLIVAKVLWVLALNVIISANGSLPILDLSAIRLSLIEDPLNPKNLWVYGMILTTLVPTYVHLVFAAGAGLTNRFKIVKSYVTRSVEAEDPDIWPLLISAHLLSAQLYIAAFLAFSIIGAVVVITTELTVGVYALIAR
jgi:hypothetical protein